MSSFKSNENIHKKEDGSYYVVSANKASSVTLLWPGSETCIIYIQRRNVWDYYGEIKQLQQQTTNTFQ